MAWIERTKGGHLVRWRAGGRGSDSGCSELMLNLPAAKREQARIEGLLSAAKPPSIGQRMPWTALIESYLAALAQRGKGATRYLSHFRNCLLTLAAARRWRHSDDPAPAQMGGLAVAEHRYLRALLRHAQLLGQPVDARALRVARPSRPRKPLAPLLADDEVAALLARARTYSPDLEAAGHLVATYGHRPESLASMAVGDVDLSAGWIEMPVKSGDRIRHPILQATADILLPLVAGRDTADPLLRHPETGQRWPSGNRLSTYWYHQVGERVTPACPGIYHLKRRAISRMLALGLDVATIASITGHRTPSVILTYARTNEARQRAALAALAQPVPSGAQ